MCRVVAYRDGACWAGVSVAQAFPIDLKLTLGCLLVSERLRWLAVGCELGNCRSSRLGYQGSVVEDGFDIFTPRFRRLSARSLSGDKTTTLGIVIRSMCPSQSHVCQDSNKCPKNRKFRPDVGMHEIIVKEKQQQKLPHLHGEWPLLPNLLVEICCCRWLRVKTHTPLVLHGIVNHVSDEFVRGQSNEF